MYFLITKSVAKEGPIFSENNQRRKLKLEKNLLSLNGRKQNISVLGDAISN